MSREGFSAKLRIFLSYARKGGGEEFATQLRKRLEKEEPEITWRGARLDYANRAYGKRGLTAFTRGML
jgi:hypothetical protein